MAVPNKNNTYRSWYYRNIEHARAYKRAMMKKSRAKNPEHHAAISRKAKRKQRERLFEMYGHVCAVCGFMDKRALTLDHRKANGNQERKKLGERGVYRRALETKRTRDYRILCMNCQFIERHKHDWKNR